MHHLEQRQKITIMVAIIVAMLFSALNQTIVGTALPHIIADLGGMEYFSWVFTSYILAASIPAVVVGRLSDIYGRKPFILAGIGIFIIGSLLSGLARDIIELIVYRGVQGVGGGIIMATAFTAIGDLFAPRERGRWQGIMGAVFGLSSVFGPTLGGYIVDHWHWQWVFWVFTPVGVIAFGMIYALFPSVKKLEGHSIDYLGSVLLTATVVPMLLAFSWAGQRYAWSSPEILSLLATTLIALALFIVVENRAQSPILPLMLFTNSVFTVSNLIVFVMGASMFGSLMYLPLFLQGVMELSATLSGTLMMPMTVSLIIASIFGGHAMTRSGRYKNLAFFGLAVTAAGLYLLSTLGPESRLDVTLTYIVIVGLGLGIGMPIFNLTVQNAVDHGHLGIATATGQLFRQLGGTIGVALMGTLMSHHMHQALSARLGNLLTPDTMAQLPTQITNHLEDPQLLLNAGELAKVNGGLSPENQAVVGQIISAMRGALNEGMSQVFAASCIAMLLAVVMVLFLREVPLRTTLHRNPEVES
ncbi:MAG: MFS transporter [Porticoccaceae bacterium]|nr:MFS transporter [Porticoccaceae bacterium]